MKIIWTDENVNKLIELWKQGLSASKIAVIFDTTKGTIIGKVHRLKLNDHGDVVTPPRKKDNEQSCGKTESHVHKEEIKKKDICKSTKGKSLFELKNDECHWPIGDPKDEDFHFCGEKVVNGKPYCAKHCAFAYVYMNK